MCVSEAEMLTFQLYLYARRRKPGLVFDQQRIQAELEEWGIKTMRELFDMPREIMSALIFPLLDSAIETESVDKAAEVLEVVQPSQQAA